ncbi:MAG: hypothetical protein ACLFV4_11390 [Candidatus Hydrogenedentota bacterium]
MKSNSNRKPAGWWSLALALAAALAGVAEAQAQTVRVAAEAGGRGPVRRWRAGRSW